MTSEVFSLLLNQQVSPQNGKTLEKRLSESKPSAVTTRIRILINHLSQPNQWRFWLARFSRKFKQNLAELEALLQYGSSHAVWEIAYLNRKKAAEKLSAVEKRELNYLTLFHDSPSVRQITDLKLKEEFGNLSPQEHRELTHLQRNLYQGSEIPTQLLELLWPHHQTRQADWFQFN